MPKAYENAQVHSSTEIVIDLSNCHSDNDDKLVHKTSCCVHSAVSALARTMKRKKSRRRKTIARYRWRCALTVVLAPVPPRWALTRIQNRTYNFVEECDDEWLRNRGISGAVTHCKHAKAFRARRVGSHRASRYFLLDERSSRCNCKVSLSLSISPSFSSSFSYSIGRYEVNLETCCNDDAGKITRLATIHGKLNNILVQSIQYEFRF